ncbi:rab GTPase activator [Martensiomyces pterosporus]|nr:rab GTPase activator [Martensiomyces pterosporus]
MDEEYDVVILGTGLTECVLSGILSVEGKKVLHMDRNDYYGGECASLNLTQLYAKFRSGAQPPAALGRDRDYNIDLIPKFLMADEGLVRVLVYTDVTRYLEFKAITASLVYRDGKVNKVPTTAGEALASPLMGFFQKRKAKSFFEFLQKWSDDDPSTHQGLDLDRDSMKAVYEYFGLDNGTQDFIGHAMALYLDDSYKNKPARETYNRIVLYTKSIGRYGPSPYIYPGYGLGELPQSFSRLSAVYGGTYMLDHSVDEIVRAEDGTFVGVRSGDQVVKAKQVIGDPSYFRESVRKTGRVIRAICILQHSIPNTDDVDSAQIIIPQNQIGREHDIYITCLSSVHNICAKGYWIASISTIAETNDDPKNEIADALKLLGPIDEIFVSVSDIYEPSADGTADNVFISRSYDATSHFETVNDDIRDLYRRISGKELELKKRPSAEEEQAAAMASAQ